MRKTWQINFHPTIIPIIWVQKLIPPTISLEAQRIIIQGPTKIPRKHLPRVVWGRTPPDTPRINLRGREPIRKLIAKRKRSLTRITISNWAARIRMNNWDTWTSFPLTPSETARAVIPWRSLKRTRPIQFPKRESRTLIRPSWHRPSNARKRSKLLCWVKRSKS